MKKRTKKLLQVASGVSLDWQTSVVATMEKSFLVLFFKKELLPSLPHAHGIDATMKFTAAIAMVFVALFALAVAMSPHRSLTTSIEIAAPPSRVWGVLIDTKNYAAWNPNMRLVGDLVPGATIENIEGDGDDQMGTSNNSAFFVAA